MEESPDQQKLYSFFQGIIYLSIVLEFVIVLFLGKGFPTPIIQELFLVVSGFFVYQNLVFSKLLTFFLILIVCVGTKARKDVDLQTARHIMVPLILGFLLFFGALFIFQHDAQRKIFKWLSMIDVMYMMSSFTGAVLIHISMDNISKRIKSNLLKDRFNIENESFEQSRKPIRTDWSVNIPMRYYYKRKTHKGWLNIVNPFRATLLIGTPGSGKTFSIIIPYIKQHLAKGFSMLVYDFKYPDLARITYHHYVKNRKQLNGHQFHMINLNHLEHSRRINPLKPEYIPTLADASETAEALIEALRKTDRTTGADQFFSQSAINFLASVIFFFTRHENGKYSTLAHVLSFLNHDYKSIFKVLFSEMELESMLSPFKSAFEQKAFDQLEGQVGTLKINLSRLATKETFWVFSGDDFNLKISDMKDPGILVIANDPDTQSINSACYSVVMNRLIRLINKKGNMPSSLIVDEVPTLYIHKIENLIATARSNKVSVLLGLQELPQFKQQYGKEAAETICAIAANVISGSARNKETLDWLEKLFGKVRQVRSGLSIDRTRTSVSMNEYMDNLIPASKIAALKAGELVAQIGREADQKTNLSTYHCKVDIDPESIMREEKQYRDLPKYYDFGIMEEKETTLRNHMIRINQEVAEIIASFS
jgi:hypothetical protein